MKKRDLRELGSVELSALIGRLRTELLKLRLQRAVGSVENPLLLRTNRRTIARALTLLNVSHRGSL